MEVLDGEQQHEALDQEPDFLALQVGAVILGSLMLLSLFRLVLRTLHQCRLNRRKHKGHATLASPPPTARLNEEEFPFSKEVEVINLITPSPVSTFNRGAGTGQQSFPGSWARSTKPKPSSSRKPAPPGPQLATSPKTKPTPKPLKSGSKAGTSTFVTPVRTLFAFNEVEPQNQGWDPALLAASMANEANISSLENLQKSTQFQTFIRSRYGNLSRYLEQVEAKLGTWNMLRSIDREAFLHAFTRSDILDVDSHPPHLVLLLLDLTLSSGITFGLFLRAYSSGADWYSLAAVWLLLQMCGAWCWGHPSLLAKWMSIYCVQGCERYPEHFFTAPGWRVTAAALLDALFTCATFGAAWLLSCGLVVCRWARQTPGQLLMRIQPMRECILGQVTVPQFASPYEKLVVQRAGVSGIGSPVRGDRQVVAHPAVSPSHGMHTPQSISFWPSPAAPTGLRNTEPRHRTAGLESVTQRRGPKRVVDEPSLAHMGGSGMLHPQSPVGQRVSSPVSQRGRLGGLDGGVDPASALRRAAVTPLPGSGSHHQPWTFGSGRRMLPPVDDDDSALLFSMQPQQPSIWQSPGSFLRRRGN